MVDSFSGRLSPGALPAVEASCSPHYAERWCRNPCLGYNNNFSLTSSLVDALPFDRCHCGKNRLNPHILMCLSAIDGTVLFGHVRVGTQEHQSVVVWKRCYINPRMNEWMNSCDGIWDFDLICSRFRSTSHRVMSCELDIVLNLQCKIIMNRLLLLLLPSLPHHHHHNHATNTSTSSNRKRNASSSADERGSGDWSTMPGPGSVVGGRVEARNCDKWKPCGKIRPINN